MKSFKSNLVILLVAFCTLHFVESQHCSMHKVSIICDKIKENTKSVIGYPLTCHVDESMTSTIPGSSVSSVKQRNGTDLTNRAQIEALNINRATVKFIPTGIKKKFPHLKVLRIIYSNLQSVNKENLKEFGGLLEILSLRMNDITFIEADLFEYNPNIIGIWLNGNLIRHIEPKFFTNVKNLKKIGWLGMSVAGCMDQSFTADEGDKIATFKWNNEKCTHGIAKAETQHLIKAALCAEAKTT